MTDNVNTDRCDVCERGKVTRRDEVMALSQWTDRGYVTCRVTIPVRTCNLCGARSWDEAAEKLIEQAVRQEYDRLS